MTWLFWTNKHAARIKQLEGELASAQQQLDFYKRYSGGQTYMSDFRTADEMREALTANRYMVAELKRVVVQTMTNKGWGLEEATTYIEREFNENKALRMLKEQNEN
jgi:hypothetical protein